MADITVMTKAIGKTKSGPAVFARRLGDWSGEGDSH